MLMTYFEFFKYPEKYYQSAMSCDNFDKDQSSRKRKRKIRNKKNKKNNDSQYVAGSLFQKTKSTTTQEQQDYLETKAVIDYHMNNDKLIDTYINEDALGLKLLRSDADENKSIAANGINTKEFKEKKVNNDEVNKEASLVLPYETIIEALIEKLSESTEDSDESEENLADEIDVQSMKNIMKKRKKSNKRRRHRNRQVSIKGKNVRLSASIPLFDETRKISTPSQSISNAQNRGTHLHFHMSNQSNLLNLTNTSDQKYMLTNNRIRPDKRIAPQPLTKTRPKDTGDQDLMITYQSFNSQNDQQSPIVLAHHLNPMVKMSDNKKIPSVSSSHLIPNSNSESFFSSNYTSQQHQNKIFHMSNITQSTTILSGSLMQPDHSLQKSNYQDGTTETPGLTNSKKHREQYNNNSTSLHEVNDKIKVNKQKNKSKKRNKWRRRDVKKQQKVKHFLQEIMDKEIKHNIQDFNKESIFSNHNQMTSRTEAPEPKIGHAPTKSLLNFLPYYEMINVTSMLKPVINLKPSTNTYSTLLISPHQEIPRVDIEYENMKQNFSHVSR